MAQILGDRRPGHYDRGNLLGFEKGPSVKFVSIIKDAIFNKKMGVNFFSGKKPSPGEGVEGGLVKDHTFPLFFTPSLRREKRKTREKHDNDVMVEVLS